MRLIERQYTRVFVKDGLFHVAPAPGNGNGKRAGVLQHLPDTPPKKAERPRHVLVVEDNLDGVHSLVLLLRDMGHQVDYAINGYAALELAKRLRPEVVLLDLNLPGLSGFEVCKRIRAMPELARMRVIAITAYDQDEYRDRSQAAGCDLHLIKPVDPRQLEDLLAS
jgi:CheY-like chemotaxis protein